MLRAAIQRRGLPERLYVESRGKQERLNRFVRGRFLSEAEAHGIASFVELNDRFQTLLAAEEHERRRRVVFIIDDDICTRCALCVDRCPTGVIILGKVGQSTAAGDTHARTNNHGYGYGMRF